MADDKDEKMNAYYEEQLQLHGSDHPGMQLVSVPPTDTNYRMWKNAISMALESKDKLGMVDGSCIKLGVESKYYRRWKKVNNMVASWIKTSISKELVSQFAYINSATALWNEIEERYGSSNISSLFQIKREIVNMKQENLGITEYYGRLKDLTDQLNELRPLFNEEDVLKDVKKDETDDFKKGAEWAIKAMMKLYEDRSVEDRAIEFLLGLNDGFNIEKNQVLLLEPLLAVNRIYSTMLKAEQNKHVINHMGADGTTMYGAAMYVKGPQQWSRDVSRGKAHFRKEKGDYARNNLFCNHCKKAGHAIETCFKLKGYPDWWDNPKKKGVAMVAQGPETPLDWNESLNATMQEFQRLMKQKGENEGKEMDIVHRAEFAEFAGP